MYKVIIIEDDPMVASINRQYVELNKYLTVTACFSNGQDALQYLETHAVDLIILDVYMPVKDGLEFLSELRQRSETLDVITVTAANDTQHIRQFLSLGVIDYLIKPFEYVRFNHALAKFMEHKELLKSHNFSQSQLDTLLKPSQISVKSELLDKGLQRKTLDLIADYIKKHPKEDLTSEKVAEEVSLSRVTVRRYMNYLLEKNEIISDIDYTTGGRPSIIYRYIKS